MISVCMATYNGGKYIREQIDSILPQLSSADELIISDDGSTDDTIEIITSFNDSRIKIFHHKYQGKRHKLSPSHYYVTSNFENALKNAKGDYIFLSDQDDIWSKNKVSVMMRELQHCDLVMSNRTNIDAKNNVLLEKAYPSNYINRGLFTNLFRNGFPGCHIAITRKLLNYSMPFPPDLILHDTWIARLAIMLNLNVAFIDEPLLLYRIHENNVSNTAEAALNKNPICYKIAYRVNLTFKLLRRALKIKLCSK